MGMMVSKFYKFILLPEYTQRYFCCSTQTQHIDCLPPPSPTLSQAYTDCNFSQNNTEAHYLVGVTERKNFGFIKGVSLEP